jgi:hypothetical protein
MMLDTQQQNVQNEFHGEWKGWDGERKGNVKKRESLNVFFGPL